MKIQNQFYKKIRHELLREHKVFTRYILNWWFLSECIVSVTCSTPPTVSTSSLGSRRGFFDHILYIVRSLAVLSDLFIKNTAAGACDNKWFYFHIKSLSCAYLVIHYAASVYEKFSFGRCQGNFRWIIRTNLINKLMISRLLIDTVMH